MTKEIYAAEICGGTIKAGETVWLWRWTPDAMPALVRKVFVSRGFAYKGGKLILADVGYCAYEDNLTYQRPELLANLFTSERLALAGRPELVGRRETPLIRAGRRQGQRAKQPLRLVA